MNDLRGLFAAADIAARDAVVVERFDAGSVENFGGRNLTEANVSCACRQHETVKLGSQAESSFAVFSPEPFREPSQVTHDPRRTLTCSNWFGWERVPVTLA